MAQNVTIMGASYPDVPAVELPRTGGGTARFADPSETTAVESDVTAGKRFLGADGTYKTGTGGGGGSDAEDGIIDRTISGSYTNGRVTSIGINAFQYCANLTAVSFPVCTSIASSAFCSCSRLSAFSSELWGSLVTSVNTSRR